MKTRMLKWWIVVLLLAGCAAASNVESSQTYELNYPEQEQVTVALVIRDGTLNVSPAAGQALRAQVTTNVRDWLPTLSEAAAGTLRMTQGESRNAVIPNARNRWDVTLGSDQTVALSVDLGAANSELTLGGLALSRVNVQGLTGNTTITYNRPNALEDGGQMQIALTSGNLNLNGVFYSHITELQSVTTGGNQDIEFGPGTLTQDFRANIEARTGNVVLRIPTGTAVRVMFTGSSGRVLGVSPEFQEVSRWVYETPEYANADQPRMQITVRTVAGDLRLIGVPPL
jgi:DUF4097 and DUF4098 domain-containing protein YvlB